MTVILDSDVVALWMFSDSRDGVSVAPALDWSEARSKFERRILPFVCVPDLFRIARWSAVELEEEEIREDYLNSATDIISAWLNGPIEVCHANESDSRQWLSMATNPLLPEVASDAHCWVSVFLTQFHAESPGSAWLGAQDRSTYLQMEAAGFLVPDAIL